MKITIEEIKNELNKIEPVKLKALENKTYMKIELKNLREHLTNNLTLLREKHNFKRNEHLDIENIFTALEEYDNLENRIIIY